MGAAPAAWHILVYLWRGAKKPSSSILKTSLAGHFDKFQAHSSLSKNTNPRFRLPDIVLILVWCLLILALSRPATIDEYLPETQDARSIFLAIDTSESMLEQDLASGETRLTVVKKIVRDFINKRAGDRIGLIVFADSPYIFAPLTLDHATILDFVDETEVGLAGQKTAIGDAVVLASKRIVEQQANEAIVIVITDGSDNSSIIPPAQAAQIAAEQGVKIYTIGVVPEPRGVFRGFFPQNIDTTGLEANSHSHRWKILPCQVRRRNFGDLRNHQPTRNQRNSKTKRADIRGTFLSSLGSGSCAFSSMDFWGEAIKQSSMTFFSPDIFFLRPEALWLVIPLCGLVYLVFKPRRNSQASGWEQLIDQDLLVYFGLQKTAALSNWGAHCARIFLLISCLLAIIGLAGPAFKGQGVQKFSSSSVVYLILDTTWSMQATDLKPTRLDFAKRKIANLLEANPESQFALLVYAEDSFVVVPPTPDKNAILHLLDDIDPSIMPSFGNRPESIAKSLKKTIQAQDRQQQAISLILLTDEIPEGKIPLALDALSAYKDLPWTIWHFGISEAPLLNPQNKKPLVDRSGKPVLGTANLAANQEFADKLQADFLQASLNNADVQRLSGWLAGNFEATERALEEDASGTIEIGYWLAIPLLAAIFLLMAQPHLLVIAMFFMGVFASPEVQASFLDRLLNDNQKGHIALKRGDYQKAQELLSNQELKNYSGFLSGDYQQDQALSPNPSIQEIYNSITTKAFAGQVQEALEGYEELLEKYELPEEIKTKVEENIAVLEEFLAQQQQQNQDRDGQNQEQQNQQQENQEQAGEDGQQQNQQNQQDGQNSSASQEQQPQTPQQAENRAQENQQAKEEFAENPQDDTVAEQGQDTQEQQALEGQSQENEQVQQAQAEKDAETTISQQNQPAQETTAAPLNYSEQYQKLIEDDPGTLLKRKFYLEKRRQARSGKRPSTNILDGL